MRGVSKVVNNNCDDYRIKAVVFYREASIHWKLIRVSNVTSFLVRKAIVRLVEK